MTQQCIDNKEKEINDQHEQPSDQEDQRQII